MYRLTQCDERTAQCQGATRRGRDAMGVGLAALNKLAGSGVIDRLGLRTPLERAVYQGARTGFRTVGVANRTFAAAQRRRQAERPSDLGRHAACSTSPPPTSRR